MVEIIAAIIGSILGGFLTWWFSRYRPNYIVCNEEFRAELRIGGPLKNWDAWWNISESYAKISLQIGLPRTQLLFEGQAVEQLSLVTLRFYNSSDKPINNPTILIKLAEGANILGCDTLFKPERIDQPSSPGQIAPDSSEKMCKTVVDDNKIYLTLDTLFPHGLNREALILDITCSGKSGPISVVGQGKYDDGSAWATKFETFEETKKRTTKQVRKIGRILIFANIAALMNFIFYLLQTYPKISFNSRLDGAFNTQQFYILVGCLALFACYDIFLIIRNKRLIFGIPFTNRRVVVSIDTYPPKVDKRAEN